MAQVEEEGRWIVSLGRWRWNVSYIILW